MSSVDPSVIHELRNLASVSNQNLLSELIDIFLITAPQQMARMKEAILQANATLFRREAHTLKSSSANLGARKLSEICAHLEVLGAISAAQPLLQSAHEEFLKVNLELKAIGAQTTR